MKRVIVTLATTALIPIVAWTAASAEPEPSVDCTSPTTTPGTACVAPAPAAGVQPVAAAPPSAPPAAPTTTVAPSTPADPAAPTTTSPAPTTTVADPSSTAPGTPTTVPADPSSTTTTVVDPNATTTTLDPNATTTTVVDPNATTTTIVAVPPEDLESDPVEAPVEAPSGRTVVAAGAIETGQVRAVTFPIAGPISYVNDWGACRDGCARAHKGNDLIGDRLQPVLAMHDGVIDHLIDHPTAGYGVAIRDDEGWQYHVYHMNNDTPGTDDASDPGTWRFLPGIVPGARVTAGQQIGWMGDSGNSEGSVPHAHVEIHRPDGTAINPYWSLRSAQRAVNCAVGTVGQPLPMPPEALEPAAPSDAASALAAAPSDDADAAPDAAAAPVLAVTTMAAAAPAASDWLGAGWAAAALPAGWVPFTVTGGQPMTAEVGARFWISATDGFTPVDASAVLVGDARYDAGVDCTTTAAPTSTIPAELGQILATIRAMETGGDYTTTITTATASGAYGFLDSSWGGYGGYARAKDAPPAVQDAKAAELAQYILARNGGDVTTIPVSWYIGHVPVGAEWDTVPKPEAGNRLTPREYQDRWMQRYSSLTGNPDAWVTGGATTIAADTSRTCHTVAVDVGAPGSPQYVLTQAQSFLVDADGRAVPNAVDPCDPGRALSAAPSPAGPLGSDVGARPGHARRAPVAGRHQDARLALTPVLDRGHLAALHGRERERFRTEHPGSAALAVTASEHLLAGVPMAWMRRWPGDFPLFVATASQGTFRDVDGHQYVDLCLGDTGAMGGHAVPAVTATIADRAARGATTMLPTADAAWVGAELARRFGVPSWQFALSATDANRFALRIARTATGRRRILVFDWCYHGTVDETLVILDADRRVVSRPGSLGVPVDPATTTAAVAFNDLDALAAALAGGDIACVLAEPAMTNIGIVLPDPGFHDELRRLTRDAGTLLVIDETHTICAGPGGYTGAHGLDPDLVVIGKPIGGGVPAAAYGLSAEVAASVQARFEDPSIDVSGIGGTLAGNALSVAAMRAALSTTLRDEDFAVAIPLAERFTAGVAGVIAAHDLPWSVQQLGCRAEYWFCPPPHDGAAAAAAGDADLEAFLHLYALNRGVLLTPFHNMALFTPRHAPADADLHTAVFDAALTELFGRRGSFDP